MIITGHNIYLALILAIYFFTITVSASENAVLSNFSQHQQYLGRLDEVDEKQLSLRTGFNDGVTRTFQKPKNDFKANQRNLGYYSSYNSYYGQQVYAYYYSSKIGKYQTDYLSSYASIYVGYNSDPDVIKSAVLSYLSYSYQSYLSYYSYTQLPTYLSSWSSYQSYISAYSSYLSYYSYSSYLYSSYLYSSYRYYSYYAYYDYLAAKKASEFPDWGIPIIVIPLMFGCGVSIPLACCAAPLCCKVRFTRGVGRTSCRRATKQCRCCKKKIHKYKRITSEYQQAKDKGLVSGQGYIPAVPTYQGGPAKYPASYNNSTMPMNYPQQYPVAAPMVQQYSSQTPMGQPTNTGSQSNPSVFYPQPQVQMGVVNNGQLGPSVNYQVAPGYSLEQSSPTKNGYDNTANNTVESSRINLVEDTSIKKHL